MSLMTCGAMLWSHSINFLPPTRRDDDEATTKCLVVMGVSNKKVGFFWPSMTQLGLRSDPAVVVYVVYTGVCC